MRNGNLFWGTAILLLGGLFLLRAAGILPNDVLGYYWPLLIVLVGIWILVGAFFQPPAGEDEAFSIALQNAKEASIKIDHGAGQVAVAAGADPGQVLTGSSGLGISHSSRLAGERLEVEIDAGPTFVPFIGPASGVWRFNLNRDIPLRLDVDCGASSLDLDLRDLQVTHLNLDTGASSSRITLPAHVRNTIVEIEAGAASVDVRVPEGVAARIRIRQGVSAVRVDPRFAYQQNGIYQSPDYDNASNRAEISVEGGAGSFEIH